MTTNRRKRDSTGGGRTKRTCPKKRLSSSKNSYLLSVTGKQSLCSSTKRSDATPSADAYEFNEPNDASGMVSHKSLSSRAHHKKKNERRAAAVTVASGMKHTQKKAKKELCSNVPMVTVQTLSRNEIRSKWINKGKKPKQTSTPVTVATGASREKPKSSDQAERRRSPRVPAGMLDLSVTPILHASAYSPAQLPTGYDPQQDSYIALQNSSKKFCSLPRALQRKDCPQKKANQGCTPVFQTSNAKDLKQKRREKPSRACSITIKCEEGVSVKKAKKESLMKSVQSSSSHQKSKAKSLSDKISRKTSSSGRCYKKLSAIGTTKHSASNNAKTSSYAREDLDMFTMWDIGKDNVCTTPLAVDSGISSLNSTGPSPENSVPDFVKDVLYLNPAPPVFTEATGGGLPLNKISSKIYKPNKTKREKGRYSLSRLEQWASKVNQDLKEAESFELSIEG